jgi:crotonobetainyl-CoA:carnitine CoA-transferase CaiB-like acyl-CoA transferase
MMPVLDGLLLIDLSTGIAGPYAAMLMAEMGADCIKIEPGEGDPARGLPGFFVWNRSKKGIAVNLEADEGRDIIYQLLKKADVLIESFSPGQAKRLGLDYDTLTEINPRLIYCAVPPFGEKGPLSEKPGNEGVVAAWSGIMGGQGGLGQPPVFVTLPLTSYGAAFLTAYGATAALYVREISNIAQKVEVSLVAGSLAMQAGGFLQSESITPVEITRNIQQGVMPVYRLYECQDEWIMISCGNQTFWNKLCIVLERADLVSDPRFENAPWGITEVEHRDSLTAIMADILSQRPREYWLKLLGDADVPCAPVSRREEFMEDAQVRHNRMIVTVEDPHMGKMKQMGIPLTLVENPGRIKSPAPRLGEHTRTVLSELGYSEENIGQLRDRGII